MCRVQTVTYVSGRSLKKISLGRARQGQDCLRGLLGKGGRIRQRSAAQARQYSPARRLATCAASRPSMQHHRAKRVRTQDVQVSEKNPLGECLSCIVLPPSSRRSIAMNKEAPHRGTMGQGRF